MGSCHRAATVLREKISQSFLPPGFSAVKQGEVFCGEMWDHCPWCPYSLLGQINSAEVRGCCYIHYLWALADCPCMVWPIFKPFHGVKKVESFKTFPWLSAALCLLAEVGMVVAHMG